MNNRKKYFISVEKATVVKKNKQKKNRQKLVLLYYCIIWCLSITFIISVVWLLKSSVTHMLARYNKTY